MRIDASGNVGIATTSPSTTLDVNGDVTITDKIIHSGDTNTALRFPAADTVTIETAGSERLRIDASGDVLIGTNNSMLGKLQVEGGRSIFAASSEKFAVGARFSSAGGAVYFGAASASSTPDAVISSAGGAVLMTLTNGGSLRIEAGDLLVATDKEINFNLGNDANNRILVNSVTGAMEVRAFNGQRFFTTNGGDSERMRIDSSGNVGIGGTANAAAILDAASTTKGFLPPRMTTAQRDAITTPPAGLMVYNTSTNKLNFYNGSAWEAVTSA
jgi:hypothetical protein